MSRCFLLRFASPFIVIFLLSGALVSQSDPSNPTGSSSPSQATDEQVRAAREALEKAAQPAPAPVIRNQEIRTDTAPPAVKPRIQNEEPGRRVAEAPEPQNDFQSFVLQTTGQRLPLFGYNLFRGGPTTFAPLDQIPVTSDYVIGPGDELLIRAWGQIDVDYRATVDRNGNIYLPKVGNIRVAGLKFEQLQPFLVSQIGRVYNNFDLNVTMGQLRSIEIFVVGQARQPGRYTVSSLSTLLNALFASGGPSPSGTMRRIQLKRGTQVVTEFDLYDMLLNGDKSKDVQLLPNDVIYIPAIGDLIAVAGGVQVPAIYELKGRTTLGAAIQLAGGLTTTAAGQQVKVERISERTVRRVELVKLDSAGAGRQVKDGDIVTVNAVSARFENAVTLRGNVALPGRYPWRPGMRIRDLIPSKDALITGEYWLKQSLVSGTTLGPGPEPGQLRNEVTRMVPDINWDYAVILRLNREDLSTTLIPFDLGKAILEGDESNNLLLQSGDVVTIFSQADIMVPRLRQNIFVRLDGEFNAAGEYKASPGETLRDLVIRAGGLTPQSYLYGSVLTREATRVDQQRQLDEFLAREEREVRRSASSAVQKASTPEEIFSARQRSESAAALLDQLRRIKASGRIVLGLRSTQKDLHDVPEIVLQDGDVFAVPDRPATVNVFGEVYNPGSFLYRPGKRVGSFLRQAGGATRNADRSHEYIIRADGSVLAKQRAAGVFSNAFEGAKLNPGDTLFVPDQFDKIGFLRGLKDWSQILGQLAIGAASIRVLSRP